MLRKRSNEEWERCEIVFEGGERNGEEKKALLKIEHWILLKNRASDSLCQYKANRSFWILLKWRNVWLAICAVHIRQIYLMFSSGDTRNEILKELFFSHHARGCVILRVSMPDVHIACSILMNVKRLSRDIKRSSKVKNATSATRGVKYICMCVCLYVLHPFTFTHIFIILSSIQPSERVKLPFRSCEVKRSAVTIWEGMKGSLFNDSINFTNLIMSTPVLKHLLWDIIFCFLR